MVFEFIAALATYGYMGAFAISLIGTAIIVYVPFEVFIVGLSSILNPVALVAVASIAASIGEFTGYFAGHYSGKFIKRVMRKEHKWVDLMKRWFHKNGFLTIVVFSATPLPVKVVDVFAGYIGYNKMKFFLAMLIGKVIIFSVIVTAGYYSAPIVLKYLGVT